MADKVFCPWCKEEMRPYPHQGYYWFQCKCGARSPTLWNATEERAREKALSYSTTDAVEVKRGKWKDKQQTVRMGDMIITGTYPTCNLCGQAEIGMVKQTNFYPQLWS